MPLDGGYGLEIDGYGEDEYGDPLLAVVAIGTGTVTQISGTGAVTSIAGTGVIVGN